jgi:uncharacterized membrane protein
MESHTRTLIKSITWRIIAVIVAFVVAYAFTHKPVESGGIAITANIINMIAYYIHERVWNKINFGRKK